MTSAGIDPVALMRIRDLQLRAKHVVEGFYNGLHRSPYHGFSVEFSQYRPYSMGDDLRNLDWKLYARTDRYHIKQFEDETSRRCYLVVDQSRSMTYASLPHDKAEYARTLAATLAYFLTRQRDSVGLLTFGDDVLDFLPARHRPGHFRRLLMMLESAAGSRSTDLVKPLDRIAAMVRRRGLVVLISDLLAPVEHFRTHLAHLRGRGHEVLVLQILDPAEKSLPVDTATTLYDLETEREVFVDPARAKAEYQRRFEDHFRTVETACQSLGVRYFPLQTDQPIEDALFELVSTGAYAAAGRGRR
jgi:uncharacterized protein (DUF58 family)